MITDIIEAIDSYITLLEDKGAPYSKNPYWKKPLQLYHGTNKEFDKFDLSKSGSSNDYGMYGKGIYLTNNKSVAKAFGGKGGHVKEIETNFKNPLYIKNIKHEKQVMRDFKKSHNVQMADKSGRPSKEFSNEFRKYLTDKGYDGYISSIPKRPKYGKMRQYVALNPDQAKITGKITEGEGMSISEECHKDIIDLVEEYINEISKELAGEVSYQRRCRDQKFEDSYKRFKDRYSEGLHKKMSMKLWKNDKLRDKWDIFKGLKRGKDGKFHSKDDYKEYKEKYETK